jgi:hypothetical protein
MRAVGPELLAWALDHHAPVLVLYARQWCHAPEDAIQEAPWNWPGGRNLPKDLLP